VYVQTGDREKREGEWTYFHIPFLVQIFIILENNVKGKCIPHENLG
jgi:hypothetical protein